MSQNLPQQTDSHQDFEQYRNRSDQFAVPCHLWDEITVPNGTGEQQEAS